jgi:hypothetical protein
MLYHGLVEPQIDPLISFEIAFFKYVIKSARFSIQEIVRNFIILKNQNPHFDFPQVPDGISVDEFR